MEAKLVNPYGLSPQEQVLRYGVGGFLDGDRMQRDYVEWETRRGERLALRVFAGALAYLALAVVLAVVWSGAAGAQSDDELREMEDAEWNDPEPHRHGKGRSCPPGEYVRGIMIYQDGWVDLECEPLPSQGGPSPSAGRSTLEDVVGWVFPEARADTGPVCAVHYSTRIEEARKHFIGAGFQDIRDLRYEGLPAVVNGRAARGNLVGCNDARVLVRRWDREGRCVSFYQGDVDWSSAQCNVYGFRAVHYIGPRGNLGRDGQ